MSLDNAIPLENAAMHRRAIAKGIVIGLIVTGFISALGLICYNAMTAIRFTRSQFKQVQPGMTTQEVRTLLGAPKRTHKLDGDRIQWTYWESGGIIPDPLYVIEFEADMVSKTEIDDY
jgi:outer membrane protein assembly factor BamE (lipoprotein component of BamABCDE complex)